MPKEPDINKLKEELKARKEREAEIDTELSSLRQEEQARLDRLSKEPGTPPEEKLIYLRRLNQNEPQVQEAIRQVEAEIAQKQKAAQVGIGSPRINMLNRKFAENVGAPKPILKKGKLFEAGKTIGGVVVGAGGKIKEGWAKGAELMGGVFAAAPQRIMDTLRKAREKITSKAETPEEEAIEKEIENLSPEDREKIGWSLATIGFKIEQKKDYFFADVFDTSLKKMDGRGTAGRFFQELRDSFVRDAQNAEKKAKDVMSGEEKHRISNAGFVFGNILKYGRTLADLAGQSLASPLRYVMMSTMAFTRVAEAGKEARLKNEEVVEKTRIQDADLAAEEAWKIYEAAQAKMDVGNVSAEALKNAYLMEMPLDLQKRLETPSVANNFIQKMVKRDIEGAVTRLNTSILDIESNSKLSAEQKEAKREKLVKKWEKSLLDYDRIVTQYGTVDELAMAGRYAQTAGKAVVAGVAVETVLLSIEKMWGFLANTFFESEAPEIKIPEGKGGGLVDQTEKVSIDQAGKVEKLPGYSHTLADVAKGALGTMSGPEKPDDVFQFETDTAATPPPFAPEHIEVNPDAIIGKGEGIEHAFIKQIEHNEALAKELGWDGKENLHHFAQGEAHRVALDKGYVDKITGEEIRIRGDGGDVAYQMKLEGDEVKIQEFKMENGKFVPSDELHGKDSPFEGAKKEDYEYKYSGKQVPEAETHALNTESTEELKQKLDAAYAEGDGTTAPEDVVSGADATTQEQAEDLRGYMEYQQKTAAETAIAGSSETDLPPEQSEISSDQPELAKTPGELLTETAQAQQRSLEFLFKSDLSVAWHQIKGMQAGQLLKYESTTPGDLTDKFADYLRMLRNYTGLEPSRGFLGFRPESAEHYLARGLQKLAETNKLAQFEADIRK